MFLSGDIKWPIGTQFPIAFKMDDFVTQLLSSFVVISPPNN